MEVVPSTPPVFGGGINAKLKPKFPSWTLYAISSYTSSSTPDGQSLALLKHYFRVVRTYRAGGKSGLRKVTVPANGRGVFRNEKFTESATENIPLFLFYPRGKKEK